MRYPQSRALVERLMQVVGIDPSEDGAIAQLARATGFDARYLYRWFSGQYRPNADNVLEILERTGVLQWDAKLQRERGGRGQAALTRDEALDRFDGIFERLDRIEERLREARVRR